MPFRFKDEWYEQKAREERMAPFRARRPRHWLRRLYAFTYTDNFLILLLLSLPIAWIILTHS